MRAMFAAEFGYSWDYVKKEFDIIDVLAHLKYRENYPHPGMMLRTLIDAFSGENGKTRFEYKNQPVLDNSESIPLAHPIAEGKPNLNRFLNQMAAAGFIMK